MRDFIAFARRMVRDRSMLAAAMVFAMISAGGMGVGIMLLIPGVKLIVDKEQAGSLPALAYRFNDAQPPHEFLGIPIEIPQFVIDTVPSTRIGGVIFTVTILAVLTVIGAAFNFLHQYLSITVATRTVANARAAIFRTALGMPLIAVTARGSSAFVTRITQDSAAVLRGLISLMSKMVAQSTQAIVLFAVAVFTGRSLTLGALVILPLLAVFLRKVGKRIRRGTRGALQRQQDLLRIATETVQGLRAVKANTAEGRAIDRFDRTNQEVVRQELRARIARAISGPTTETIAVFAIGILVIFAAREIIAERLTLDRFLVALGSLAIAGSKLKIVARLVNEVQAATAPARRLLDVLDEEPEEEPGTSRPDLARHERSIRFETVSLTYPGAEERALREVSLEVAHGARIAIVGPNGCGKTTLLSLIPRLFTPDEGTVLIDGVDLATVNLASIRNQVSLVTQETVMFRGSIAENIAFGRMTATREAITDAARRAHAHEFIMRIPGGYDADIAEQGASLSGGQRQRIAIARAILRDPSILILDEATSQIDAESEAHISAAIAEFCRGRTVLVIAHRLATVLDADRIVVMDAGCVIDQGSHEELLGRSPLYRRLSQTQLISVAS